ncbi:MAG: ABC transporter ATP-binding protein [Pseudorhodoplanes sp.]
MSVPSVLTVRGLSKSFGGLVVADGIDLDLPAGARLGLIGPNGAGKTTFVNLLTGILAPSSGSIRLGEESIEGLRPEKRVVKGLVRTHQINTLLNEMTARENVAIAVAQRERITRLPIGNSRKWRQCRDEADQWLADLDLSDVSHRAVSEMSYGQQRLLEIAIALALRPRVLLLDEPAAGVPSLEVHVIHRALERLPEQVATIIIEHDMDIIYRFAQQIMVLVRGAVLVRGTPAEISADPAVRAVYLGKAVS